MSLTVEIKTLAHFGDLELPKYETVLAAGADLRAAVPADAPMVLEPGARALVPTGMAMALPAGYEAQIRPRSGLAYCPNSWVYLWQYFRNIRVTNDAVFPNILYLRGHDIGPYQSEDPAYVPVTYEGQVNLRGTEIKGIWKRPDWSGTFMMQKDKGQVLNKKEKWLLLMMWKG